MAFGKGSRGTGVRQLQGKLDAWIKEANGAAAAGLGDHTGLIGVIADGSFGANTEVALATFQRFQGLHPSGYADADTLVALDLPGNLEASGIVVIDSTGGGV